MVYTISVIIFYLAGYLISFYMLRVDHESEGEVYTKGDKAINVVFSFLSWLMIAYVLIASWIKKVGRSEYWNRPVKAVKAVTE